MEENKKNIKECKTKDYLIVICSTKHGKNDLNLLKMLYN